MKLDTRHQSMNKCLFIYFSHFAVVDRDRLFLPRNFSLIPVRVTSRSLFLSLVVVVVCCIACRSNSRVNVQVSNYFQSITFRSTINEAEQIGGADEKRFIRFPEDNFRHESKWKRPTVRIVRWRFTQTKSGEKSFCASSSSSFWSFWFRSLVALTEPVGRSVLMFWVVRCRFFCVSAYLFDQSVNVST